MERFAEHYAQLIQVSGHNKLTTWELQKAYERDEFRRLAEDYIVIKSKYVETQDQTCLFGFAING